MDDKGILEPIAGCEGYFGVNGWMKDNFVPFVILQGILGPFLNCK